MDRPRTDQLPPRLASVARGIAGRLRESGKQAWIVGGIVRDLVLGRAPSDLDLATDAVPEELERLFDVTLAVGRAFGTVIVRWEGTDCEVTTFRSDSEYGDSRHPDSVTYSTSAEVDALRRDFTCNALYLDPLDDRFLDPTRGLEDLVARRLRAVGDARARLAEDALRILRMARFAACPGLEPDEALRGAASELAERLARVAPERRARELSVVLGRPGAARAVEELQAAGALRWAAFEGREDLAARCHGRAAILRALDPPPTLAAGWGILLGSFEEDEWRGALEALRPSRELLRAVAAVGDAVRACERLAAEPDAPRSQRIRLFREEAFPAALAIQEVRAELDGGGTSAALRALGAEARALSPEELRPAPLVTSADLASAGVPRGPRWSELLEEAETAQLDGRLADRDGALAWLAGRAQDGGNGLRRSQDAG